MDSMIVVQLLRYKGVFKKRGVEGAMDCASVQDVKCDKLASSSHTMTSSCSKGIEGIAVSVASVVRERGREREGGKEGRIARQ
jgi:hypothetical protein